ncbi:pirin family protein [soil metagenome]
MTLPNQPDPIFGDEASANAIAQVVVPRVADLGGFSVRRALPSKQRQMVGPFIFLDSFGPANFAIGDGVDVRPHPHIGLATVTYLMDGEIMHRDSLGSACPIRPGDLNWMTAGKGIVHSERTPPDERARGAHMRGLQAWVALPKDKEESEATFAHYDRTALPYLSEGGKDVRIIAGRLFGETSPVAVASDLFYADVSLAAGTRLPLDADHEERALYLLQGKIRISGDAFDGEQLLVFRPGDRLTIEAVTPCQFQLMGGAPLEGPRHIWWNFVSSSRERIDQAREDWKRGRFDPVPGETEFIPVPDV